MQSPDRSDFWHRVVTSANWGMLAGFWVELPLLSAFLLKPNNHAHWGKLNEWSVRLVLPATLVGVVYGWAKPELDRAHLPVEKAASTWAAAEQARAAERDVIGGPNL